MGLFPAGQQRQRDVEPVIAGHDRPSDVVLLEQGLPAGPQGSDVIEVAHHGFAVKIGPAIDEDLVFGDKLEEVPAPLVLVEDIAGVLGGVGPDIRDGVDRPLIGRQIGRP